MGRLRFFGMLRFGPGFLGSSCDSLRPMSPPTKRPLARSSARFAAWSAKKEPKPSRRCSTTPINGGLAPSPP